MRLLYNIIPVLLWDCTEICFRKGFRFYRDFLHGGSVYRTVFHTGRRKRTICKTNRSIILKQMYIFVMFNVYCICVWIIVSKLGK